MMKSKQLFAYLVLCLALAFTACQSDDSSNAATTPAPTTVPNTVVTPPAATTPAPPTAPVSGFAGEAEPHYKCPNNCAGGHGPGQGSCPVCGTAMVHNAAYHNSGSSTTINPTIQQPNIGGNTTSSAQNAAGVFHYTCSNGCAGGAGSAVACSTCGNTLVHNPAYHGN